MSAFGTSNKEYSDLHLRSFLDSTICSLSNGKLASQNLHTLWCLEKNKHLTTCPIFQSTLTLPIIDFSSIDTNISGPFPTAKLHEAVNLKVENIANKQTLIDLIIKDFIPNFDKSKQDKDHRQILIIILNQLFSIIVKQQHL
ncbi:13622_t:CDS:2, partial [Entrophospora sp. SA101]